ncbi:MAG: lipoprotein [Desulfobacterales bacterium]|nr:lipoprotein [Desulfobacterales bacterium]
MKKIFIIFIAVFTLTACNDGGGGNKEADNNDPDIGTVSYTPSNCSTQGQNEFVYKVMTDTYLWYDKVADTDYTGYDSPEELLYDMRHDEFDRWSYLISKEEYHTLFEEGKFIGLGYGSKYDNNGDLRIRFVYKDSPVDLAGLKRGDKFLEINGIPVEEIENNNLWNTIHGRNDIGVKVHLKIESSENIVRELQLEKDWVTINTVLHYEIKQIEGLKIGYLAFLKFLETSQEELYKVFAYFNQENIDELILDLRYNTGGRTSIARYLAGLIAGDKADGKIFNKYIHNDNHSSWNWSTSFTKPANALNLDRVTVITSEKTCSASELVVNSLEPFIDVIMIGGTTCGKPVGMYGHDFCDKHISPIEFKSFNAYDEGDFFDGMPADCFADDDLTRELGDTQESSLNQALYFIFNDSCFAEEPERRKHDAGKDKNIYLHGFRGEIDAF